MLGGSPYYKNAEEIEMLFEVMDKYFAYITKKGYIPDAYQYRTPTDGALPCGQDGISGITVHGWLWHDIL